MVSNLNFVLIMEIVIEQTLQKLSENNDEWSERYKTYLKEIWQNEGKSNKAFRKPLNLSLYSTVGTRNEKCYFLRFKGQNVGKITVSNSKEVKLNSLVVPGKSHELGDCPILIGHGAVEWHSEEAFNFRRYFKQSEKDALFGLHAIQYAPKRILGYSNDEEEDMEPSIINTYTSNLTLNVNGIYGNGKHSPGGEEFQTSTRFQPGDGVLCVLRHLNIVFPAIYEGPITLDSLKEWYDNDEMSKIYYDSFEDFVKEGLWDCDWDSVIVRPLVKIDNEEWYDKMLVRRPFVFPYKQFDI